MLDVVIGIDVILQKKRKVAFKYYEETDFSAGQLNVDYCHFNIEKDLNKAFIGIKRLQIMDYPYYA